MRSKNFLMSQQVILGMLLWSVLFASTTTAEVHVERTSFAATGYNESVVYIDTPGRYSFQAHSEQGTRLELVDWMAGPMEASGQVGKQDGRLDVLLDAGSYKVRLNSHSNGSGELRLDVLPFREVQSVERPEDLPVLNELQLHRETLGDLLQQSFWIYLSQRQVLRLEALGRNLKDCRLWLDGEWLVDAAPTISTFEPVSGQPMTHIEFFHDLNPGLYKLTCYGGEPLAWAEETEEHPFYVRMGIPELGTVGQRLITVSSFGRETFLVSGDTDFFELARQEKADTILRIGSVNAQASRYSAVLEEEMISKESRDPWCTVYPGQSDHPRFVTVQSAPGDTLTLQYFIDEESRRFAYDSPRNYWVSSHSSEEAADAMDLTAILARYWRGSERISIGQQQALNLSQQEPIRRKVNLLGEFRAFVFVHDPGTYMIQEDPDAGGKGRYRLEPLLFLKPRDYQAPEYQKPEANFALTEGLYILSVIPDSQGIVAFVLRHQEGVPINPITPDVTAEDRLLRQRLLWTNLQLAAGDDYVLTLSPRHGVVSGLLVRPLPLDLSDPLPVTLLPDEQVPIQMEVTRSSTLIIDSDTNAAYRISGYSDPIKSGATLLPGRYTLNLKNTSSQPAFFSVKTVPASIEPPLSQENLARRMQEIRKVFPTLTETQPIFENFDRREQRHYTLRVEHPGLYRLETSGRLATSLTVRTRFVTALFTAQSNGIGRNALVQQYLKPGEYQVTVQATGQSKGRAALHLRRVPLTEEAGLAPGIRKKIHLRADEAVRYRFDIAVDGNYLLRTLGLNKAYAWRLEDHAGWPLVRPNQTGPIRQYFPAGTYHYFSLPDDVEGRRITALDFIPASRPELQGKGPHTIALNESIEHVWREEDGRPPDRFVIFLPDPVTATVAVSEDMLADVYACQTDAPSPCRDIRLPVRGGETRTFDFGPGYFEFQVRSLDETDRLPYSFSISTGDLITGLRHRVNNLPAEFTVKTGDERLVELFSFGAVDVKATLTDSAGKLVATGDDQPNDWNFRISQKLQPGAYTLRVQSIGERGNGELEVAMTKRDEVEFSAATFPFTLDADIQHDVGAITFTTADDAGLARIRVNAHDPVKLALYQEKRLLTEGDRELWLPLRPAQTYTLVFWRAAASPVTDAVEPVTLDAAIFPVQELDLSKGALEFAIPSSSAEIVALHLAQGDKQSYVLKSPYPLRFSAQPETAFSVVTDVPVVLPEAAGWLLVDVGADRIGADQVGADQVGADQAGQRTLTITPFALAKPTEVVALGSAALPFDLEQTADAPVLLEIASIGATIGAVVADQALYTDQFINWPGMARSPSQTLVAFAGTGAYRGRIWATTDDPINGKVLLTRREFPQVSRLELHPSGQHEGRIPAGEAHIFPLVAVPQIFDLLLSKDLVAFVWKDGRTEALAAAVADNAQQRISITGGELIVLNTGQQTGLYRIAKNEAAAQTASDILQPFDPAAGFEQVFRAAGTLALDIPASDRHLFVAGDKIASRFLRTDGRISDSAGDLRLEPSPGGLLEIAYEPGYVRVWLSTPERQAFENIQPATLTPAFADVPAETFADGLGALQNAPQRWDITLSQPQYIVATAGAPGMMALVGQEQVLAASVGSANAGHQLRYFLQPGRYGLWTRPLTDVAQQGNLRLQTITPYDLDAAMLKPWLIQSGEIQVFRFEVAATTKVGAPTRVGVGVATESDRLAAELRDRDFHLLASGPLILQELEAGEYLLIVQPTLADGAPVQYRPVVYGHKGSDQGIPDDVLKEYQQLRRE